MKNTLPSFAFALLLAALLAPPSMPAQESSSLEDQLRKQYAGSERMMRKFYAGPHLKFDAQGNLTSEPLTGPWTVFGRVTIDQLRLQAGKLRMEGHRQPVVFVEASKEWKRIPWEGTWTMEIATRPGPEQASQIEGRPALPYDFIASLSREGHFPSRAYNNTATSSV
ncbi:MAG: hypothetical protein LAP21_03590 [Acidobacteriia bacterium]|nr:hypothetical protein [Terriglobia bacterium]